MAMSYGNSEMDYLRERISNATSSAEFDHFREKLEYLERDRWGGYGPSYGSVGMPPIIAPPIITSPVAPPTPPEPATPTKSESACNLEIPPYEPVDIPLVIRDYDPTPPRTEKLRQAVGSEFAMYKRLGIKW